LVLFSIVWQNPCSPYVEKVSVFNWQQYQIIFIEILQPKITILQKM